MTSSDTYWPPLIEHLQWRIDSEDRAREQILNRAGVLLGLVGVEIGALVAMDGFACQGVLAGVMAGLLVFAAGFLLKVLTTQKIEGGAVADFREVISGKREVYSTIGEQLLKCYKPGASQLEQLIEMNNDNGCVLTWGLCIFLSAQLIAPLIILSGSA